MKDVKRFDVQGKFESQDGEGIVLVNPKMVLEADYDAAISKLAAETLRADTAEAELRTERLRADAAVGDANDAERELAAAEQRIANLKGLLEEALGSVYAEGRRAETAFSSRLVLGLADRIEAALNPKPEAGSHE